MRPCERQSQQISHADAATPFKSTYRFTISRDHARRTPRYSPRAADSDQVVRTQAHIRVPGTTAARRMRHTGWVKPGLTPYGVCSFRVDPLRYYGVACTLGRTHICRNCYASSACMYTLVLVATSGCSIRIWVHPPLCRRRA